MPFFQNYKFKKHQKHLLGKSRELSAKTCLTVASTTDGAPIGITIFYGSAEVLLEVAHKNKDTVFLLRIGSLPTELIGHMRDTSQTDHAQVVKTLKACLPMEFFSALNVLAKNRNTQTLHWTCDYARTPADFASALNRLIQDQVSR